MDYTLLTLLSTQALLHTCKEDCFLLDPRIPFLKAPIQANPGVPQLTTCLSIMYII